MSMMDSSFIVDREEAIDYYADYVDGRERDSYMPPSVYVSPQVDLAAGYEDVEITYKDVLDIITPTIDPWGTSVGGAAGMAQAYEEEHGYLLEGMPVPLWDDYNLATPVTPPDGEGGFVYDDGEIVVITDDDGEVVLEEKDGLVDETVDVAIEDVSRAASALVADIDVPLDFKIGGGLLIVGLLLFAVIAVST